MRGVGREAALRIVAVLQAVQHGVQGVDQAADLVLRAGMGQALVQAGFADRMGLVHHIVDGAQHAAREHFAGQPHGRQQGQRHGAKQHGGRGQHVVGVVERAGHLHRQARAGRGHGDRHHAQRLFAELGQGLEDGFAGRQARQQGGRRRQLRRFQIAAARQHAAFAIDDLHQAVEPCQRRRRQSRRHLVHLHGLARRGRQHGHFRFAQRQQGRIELAMHGARQAPVAGQRRAGDDGEDDGQVHQQQAFAKASHRCFPPDGNRVRAPCGSKAANPAHPLFPAGCARGRRSDYRCRSGPPAISARPGARG
ncbi:hypothetical protein D3C72_1311730 [compost metagenome]